MLLQTLAALAPALSLAPADSAPVRVFVLAGQSNMQGHGRIEMEQEGDLADAAAQEAFAYLRANEQWVEREDVHYIHTTGQGEVVQSTLRVGLGARADSIGPELAFGHVLGEHFEEPVLLIKTAWGGQALGHTFRPPSAGLPEQAVLEDLLTKARRKNPEATLDEIRTVFGSKYRQMIAEVHAVLDDLGAHVPALAGREAELAGFFWHQGWNDGCSREWSAQYETNMVHFIGDVRRDLGVADLPFVIATSGMGGPDATGVAGWLAEGIEPKQIAAAEQFERCVAVPTRHFQRHKPGRQKSHWHNSAESYCLVGDASARALLEVLSAN